MSRTWPPRTLPVGLLVVLVTTAAGLPSAAAPAATVAVAAASPASTVALATTASWNVRRGDRPPAAWWRRTTAASRVATASIAVLPRRGTTTLRPGRRVWLQRSFSLNSASQVAAASLRVAARGTVVGFVNGHRVTRLGQSRAGWDPVSLPPDALRVGANTMVVRLAGRASRFAARVVTTGTDTALTPPVAPTPVPVVSSPTTTPPPSAEPTPPVLDATTRVLCRITDSRLPEISGMTASLRHPGIVWVHNDSGDTARIFAVSTQTCEVQATVRLTGVTARDFESLALGRDPAGAPELWVGDTGDNGAVRDAVQLHRFSEPEALADQSVTPTTTTVTWTDGARDCESLLVDPVPGGSVYLISKEPTGGVYRLRGDVRGGAATTGTRLSDVGSAASDAAIAPDQSRSIVRYYNIADLWAGVLATNRRRLSLPTQAQGEAITFSPDSNYVYLATEGAGDLIRVPVWNR